MNSLVIGNGVIGALLQDRLRKLGHSCQSLQNRNLEAYAKFIPAARFNVVFVAISDKDQGRSEGAFAAP